MTAPLAAGGVEPAQAQHPAAVAVAFGVEHVHHRCGVQHLGPEDLMGGLAGDEPAVKGLDGVAGADPPAGLGVLAIEPGGQFDVTVGEQRGLAVEAGDLADGFDEALVGLGAHDAFGEKHSLCQPAQRQQGQDPKLRER